MLEDDFDFTGDGVARVVPILAQLVQKDWGFFYGAHVLPPSERQGLIEIASDEPVLTASFVGFRGSVIPDLVGFLEAMQLRPGGSPDYGPMHVDGAYTFFRMLHPQHSTFVAFPSLGRQRSSPSDITARGMVLDRWHATRGVAALMRRGYNWLRRQ